MSLFHLAWRNTRRQPRRTLLTMLAVAVAVAATTFIDAYMNGAMDSVLNTFIQTDAGHVKVMPRKAVDRVRMLPLDDGFTRLDSLVNVISSVDGVEQVAPRIRFGVLLDGDENAVPAIGVATIPSHEEGLLNLREVVTDGRVPQDGSDEVLLGDQLAADLNLAIGGELFLVANTSYGGLGPGVYRVVGLAHTGVQMLDRKQFYIPLHPAQEQLAMENRALEIVCRVKDGRERSIEVAAAMQEALDRAGFENAVAVPWQKQGYLYSAVQQASLFEGIMMLLLAVIALTTVINTVLMSVMERVREIGALRALGFDRGTVIRLVLTESLIVGVVGTVAGVALGMAVSLWLQHTGLDFSNVLKSVEIPLNPVIHPRPSWLTALKASLFGLLVALAAAWYPARVAVRLEPARALGTHRG